VLKLDLEQAVFGAEEELEVRTAIPCDTCEATGAAPGTRPQPCDECGGSGQVRRVRQSILGQMVTAGPCGTCGGLGQVIEQRCTDCGGEGRRVESKSYVVDIPPGVDTGSTLRLGGRGAVGARGGAAGDLFVHIEVRDHALFTRAGDDLRFRLDVSPAQAVLGVGVEIETFDGPHHVDVPHGVPSGAVLKVRGLGAPRLRGRGRGDLLVDVVVDTPAELTEEEDDLYRRLAELKGEDVAQPGSGLVGKLRSKLK
jgi:molecular chaperone DnaJ